MLGYNESYSRMVRYNHEDDKLRAVEREKDEAKNYTLSSKVGRAL